MSVALRHFGNIGGKCLSRSKGMFSEQFKISPVKQE